MTKYRNIDVIVPNVTKEEREKIEVFCATTLNLFIHTRTAEKA